MALVAALQALAVLVERQRPASEVLRLFDPLPQRLRSVRFTGGSPLTDSRMRDAVAEAEASLATNWARSAARERYGTGGARDGGRRG